MGLRCGMRSTKCQLLVTSLCVMLLGLSVATLSTVTHYGLHFTIISDISLDSNSYRAIHHAGIFLFCSGLLRIDPSCLLEIHAQHGAPGICHSLRCSAQQWGCEQRETSSRWIRDTLMLPSHLFKVTDVVGDQRAVCQKAGQILLCAGGAQLHQNPGGSIHAGTVAIALLRDKKPCPIMVQYLVQKLKPSPSGSRSQKAKSRLSQALPAGPLGLMPLRKRGKMKGRNKVLTPGTEGNCHIFSLRNPSGSWLGSVRLRVLTHLHLIATRACPRRPRQDGETVPSLPGRGSQGHPSSSLGQIQKWQKAPAGETQE
ncbi:tetraspanin-32 isoform X2 [Falco rusticolus]|uniref:tetraspanin-32 isoform X2 n=1 Tax=Falco rusticolus TaxID=120794 RepID=UPI000FFBAAE5|nr:tetraspanin-32 isoform X2 [Falco rusticolus]